MTTDRQTGRQAGLVQRLDETQAARRRPLAEHARRERYSTGVEAVETVDCPWTAHAARTDEVQDDLALLARMCACHRLYPGGRATRGRPFHLQSAKVRQPIVCAELTGSQSDSRTGPCDHQAQLLSWASWLPFRPPLSAGRKHQRTPRGANTSHCVLHSPPSIHAPTHPPPMPPGPLGGAKSPSSPRYPAAHLLIALPFRTLCFQPFAPKPTL